MKKTFFIVCVLAFAASFAASAEDQSAEFIRIAKLFNAKSYQAAQKELVNFIEKYGSYGNVFDMLRECNDKLGIALKQEKDNVSQANKQRTAAEVKLIEQQNLLAAAKEEINSLRAQNDKDYKAMQSVTQKAIADKGASMDQLNKQIADLTAQKDSLDKKITELEGTLKNATESLAAQRDSSKVMGGKINQLDSLSKKQFLGLITYKAVEEIIHPEKFEKKAQTTPQTGTEAEK